MTDALNSTTFDARGPSVSRRGLMLSTGAAGLLGQAAPAAHSLPRKMSFASASSAHAPARWRASARRTAMCSISPASPWSKA